MENPEKRFAVPERVKKIHDEDGNQTPYSFYITTENNRLNIFSEKIGVGEIIHAETMKEPTREEAERIIAEFLALPK